MVAIHSLDTKGVSILSTSQDLILQHGVEVIPNNGGETKSFPTNPIQ